MASPALNPNTGYLEGMSCPKCGSYGPFVIEVVKATTFHDHDASCEPYEDDPGYHDESPCLCDACEFASTVMAFCEEGREPTITTKED